MEQPKQQLQSMKACLFGRFRVFINDEIKDDFSYEQVKYLFALLCASPHEILEKETLAQYFWENKAEKRAKHNLRQAIFSMKKDFSGYESELFESKRKTLAFRPPSNFTSDICEFEKESATLTLQELKHKVSLYQGEFLEELKFTESLVFDDWLQEKRRFYKEIYQSYLETLASLYREQGNFVEEQDCWAQLLDAHPWDEKYHLQQMKSFVAQGLKTAAKNQYKRLETTLKKELDLKPGEEVTQFYLSLMQEQQEPKPQQLAVGTGQLLSKNKLPVFSIPFVQREIKQKRVSSLLQQPDTHIVSLIGSGGTGKTRLACHIGSSLKEDFPDGVFFVSFIDYPKAFKDNNELFFFYLSEKLSLHLEKDKDIQENFFSFWKTKQCLFILDNFESVLSHAPLLSEWLSYSQQSKVLVTSRQPLACQGEMKVPLRGLGVHDKENTQNLSNAAKFFYSCLEEIEDIDESILQDHNSVEKICRFLGGHPIAIQNIAKWADHLDANEILEKLQTTEKEGDELLEQSLEYSWSLLFQEQKQVLFLLGFLQGPLAIKVACKLAQTSTFVLNSLSSQGWLTKLSGSQQILIHDIYKQFLLKKVKAESNIHTMERAFIQFFLVDYWKQKNYASDFDQEKVFEITHLWPHIRYSFLASIHAKEWDLIEELLPLSSAYYTVLGGNIEELQLLDFILETIQQTNGPKQLENKALLRKAEIFVNIRDLASFETVFSQITKDTMDLFLSCKMQQLQGRKERYLKGSGLEIALKVLDSCRSINWQKELPFCYLDLAREYRIKGDFDQAKQQLIQSQREFKNQNNLLGRTHVSNALAAIAFEEKDFLSSENHLHQGHSIGLTFNNPRLVSRYHINISLVKEYQEEFEESIYHLEIASQLAKDNNDQQTWPFACKNLGRLYAKLGKFEQAMNMFQLAFDDLLRQKNAFSLCSALIDCCLAAINQKRYDLATLLLWQALTHAKNTTQQSLYDCFLCCALILPSIDQQEKSFQLMQFLFSQEDYQPVFYVQELAKKQMRLLFDQLSTEQTQSLQELTLSTEEALIYCLSLPYQHKTTTCQLCIK